MKNLKPVAGLLLLIGVMGVFYGSSVLFDDPGRRAAKIDYDMFIAPSIQLFIDQPFDHAVVHYNAAMNPAYFIVMAKLTNIFGNSVQGLQVLNVGLVFLSLIAFYISLMRFGLAPLFALFYSLPIALSPYLKYSAIELNTDHFASVFLILGLSLLLGSVKQTRKNNYVFLTVSILSILMSVYTRQNYLSVLVILLILITKCIPEKAVRRYCYAVSLLGLVPLLFLFLKWGGFVNPNFQEVHQSFIINASNINYGILNGLVYFFPFVVILWMMHGLTISRAAVLKANTYVSLLIMLIAAGMLTIGFDYSRLDTDGGGLLIKAIKYLPHFYLQSAILFLFVLFFFFSSYLVLVVMKEKLLYTVFIILILPLFFNNASYPKYFDPMVMIVLISAIVMLKENAYKKLGFPSAILLVQLFIVSVLFLYTTIIKL